MGLDMRPMGKPKPGFEKRFEEIFSMLTGKAKAQPLANGQTPSHEELLEEWFAIQESTYETIKAPRVGRDAEADQWIKEQYQETDQSVPEQEFIKNHEGYYVIELAKETDGVPIYRAMGQDENVFRGEFLRDCMDIVDEELLSEAWETKMAAETLDYGWRLYDAADKIAVANNLEYLKNQREAPDADEDQIESKLHILYSAARWLIFYGKSGHGYEADF